LVRRACGDLAHVIHSDDAFPLIRLRDGFFFRKPFRCQARLHRPAFAEMPRQRPRVDPLDPGNVPARQIIFEGRFRTPVARNFAQLFDDKAPHVRFATFLVERVRPVIADERISHGDDLAAIRGIGQHFLVTGHRSVETNFADAGAGGAE